MSRFFFDIASGNGVRYDYQGREFLSTGHARGYAELLALDLICTDTSDGAEEVEVRDVRGVKLFAVPVQELELAAA